MARRASDHDDVRKFFGRAAKSARHPSVEDRLIRNYPANVMFGLIERDALNPDTRIQRA